LRLLDLTVLAELGVDLQDLALQLALMNSSVSMAYGSVVLSFLTCFRYF
jgi:hypothetical protein